MYHLLKPVKCMDSLFYATHNYVNIGDISKCWVKESLKFWQTPTHVYKKKSLRKAYHLLIIFACIIYGQESTKTFSWRVGRITGPVGKWWEAIQLVVSIGSTIEVPCSSDLESFQGWESKVLYVRKITRCNLCTTTVPWHELDMDTTRDCRENLL